MTDIVGLCVRNLSWFIDPVIRSIMDAFFSFQYINTVCCFVHILICLRHDFFFDLVKLFLSIMGLKLKPMTWFSLFMQ